MPIFPFALAIALVAATGPMIQTQTPSATVRLTQSEVEALVRADAAKLRQVKPEAVSVVKTVPRTWPDSSLGCGVARKGLDERPVPVEGFVVKVSVGGEALTYHTDRAGRVLRCPAPAKKPLDRISH
jgi:hypothetical protein